MYDVPERTSWLEPKESEAVDFCSECNQDIFAGEEYYEIGNDSYCERCIENSKATASEKENYFETAV